MSENLTMSEAADALYGDGDGNVKATGTIVSIPIGQIRPDIRQPRRIVPSAVYAVINNRRDIGLVLSAWQALAEKRYGKKIGAHEAIMSHGNGPEDGVSDDAVVVGWFELLALAASIQRDGLTNAITVVKHERSDFLLETGERRWLAHHVLVMFGFERFHVIPARIVERADVWRQASENGRRQSLNAIGMARQLALLLMELYQHEKNVEFYAIDDPIVVDCDRQFYAQVENGSRYPIPRGYGQRLLDVMGLPSISVLGRYRALLRVADDLWMVADDEHWAEGKIRSELDALKSQGPISVPDQTIGGMFPDDAEANNNVPDVHTPPDADDDVDWSDDPVPGDEGLRLRDVIDPQVDLHMRSRILDEHPGDLLTGLMFLHQMAIDWDHTLAVNQLNGLIDMSRERLHGLVKNSSPDYWNAWSDAADDQISELLNNVVANFRTDFESYLTQLTAIADGIRCE